MKLRHRILSLILAISILFTMALPAFAVNTSCAVTIGNQSTSFTLDFGNAEDQQVSSQHRFENVPVGGTLKTSCDVAGILNVTSSSQSGELQGWSVVGVADGPTNLDSGLTTEQVLAYEIPSGWNTVCFEPMFGGNQGGNQGGGTAYQLNICDPSTSYTLVFEGETDAASDDELKTYDKEQSGFSNAPIGSTIRSFCGIKDITDVSHTSGQSFSGTWQVLGIKAGDNPPDFIAQGLTTQQALNYPLPENTGGWHTICFVPQFGGNQGGGQGIPAVGGDEGIVVWLGADYTTFDVTVKMDNGDKITGTANNYYIAGGLQKGRSLADAGVVSVSDPVSLLNPNRKFLGWAVRESTGGGVRDFAELLSTEEMLNFKVPGWSLFSITIYPVWEDLDARYIADVTFMYFGAQLNGMFAGTMGNGGMPRGEKLKDTDLGNSIQLNYDPTRENDTFLGWKRIIQIDSYDQKGNYKGTTYDTSDTNIYTREQIKDHIIPEEPYTGVYYVSIWESNKDQDFTHFGSGGATGVTIHHRTALFFEGEGSIEMIEKYSDGYSTTHNPNFFSWFNIIKGVPIGSAFEGTQGAMQSYGINIHRNGYNFTGWNVYRIKASELYSSPKGTEEFFADVSPDRYIVDMGIDEDIDGNWLYEEYTEYELMYEKLSHEAVFAIPVTGDWFAVPTWELSEKLPIEVPGLDDPGFEYYLSIQEDVQLPINVDESRYGDVSKVKESLVHQMNHWAEKRSTKLDGSKIVEIKLLAKNLATDEWEDISDRIPAEGVEITIPFPDKNMDSSGKHKGWQNGKYVVFHFISSGPNAGEIEELPCTNTPYGLKVKVTSLSPFAVAKAEEQAVTPSEDGAGRQNPNTGV